MRRETRFRQHEVRRALKAADAAGLKVAKVEFDPSGKFAIVIGDGASINQGSPFDIWKAKHNARASEGYK